MEAAKKKQSAIIWGIVAAVVLIIVGVVLFVNKGDYMYLIYLGGAAVPAFTLVSCLILDNNFLGDMIMEIISWSFVRFPGIIFTLDLDGILFFIGVKLLFGILAFLLGAACTVAAIGLGAVLSLFVFPFAIAKEPGV